jgi:hypothetical protein
MRALCVAPGINNLQHVKKEDLVCIEASGSYYYFLILSGSAFFGCQWSYIFHSVTKEISKVSEILKSRDDGFLALVDFIEERRRNVVTKVEKKIDTSPFFEKTKLKARIDTFGGGHKWYIYDLNFNILKKQNGLLPWQKSYPIATGMKCRDAMKLIDKKWIISQVIYEEGQGQFPF